MNLAIPVLASIYEGLNAIATSSRPARTSPSFPVHFVYAWLAFYFKTHYPIWQGLHGPKMTRFSGERGAKYYDPQGACKRIHKSEFVSWACNMIMKNRPFKFIDNGDAEELDHDYFIAIRLSYLTLRQGDKFIIEPYSSHRFGRQFGYFQDVPGTLKYDTRTASLEEGLRYWRLCVLSKSSSKAWLPGLPTNTKKFCSEAYKSNSQAVAVEASKEKGPLHNLVDSDSSNNDRHWKRQKEFTPLKAVEASALRSPSADCVAQLENEIQSIDASEESETSHLWTTTPPFGMGLKGKQLPQPPTVSVLEVDFLSSIEDDVYLILESMKSFRKFDITKKLPRSLHEQYLKEARARLQDVQAKASEGASKVQSIVDELEHVEKEIVALKGRRTSLCAALKEQKQLNHDAQAKVHEVEEDIATLDNTAPLDDAIVDDSKANLEILKEDLKSLKTFYLRFV
ncbi:UNVERIFIED_CONTAM: hypothetical protein Slati_1135900 [Sesamum latifolium]|uniref:Aminotransferase-like plant mobile domain-containing protein n=1 Tax=Sesamum latifolium TaxID=2727402 RepID=A0AAW2XD38_9LAMI